MVHCNSEDLFRIHGKFVLIYICILHVLSHLLLIYICKLHWNLNSCFCSETVLMKSISHAAQVNYF